MKKKFMLLLTVMLLSGMTAGAAQPQITEEDAKNIALENAGQKEEDVSRIQTKTDREDGWEIIEVEFTTEDKEEYDYEIMVDDGTILNISYERKRMQENGEEITLEEAKEAAAEHAGEKLDEVTFTKEKTEKDDGRLVHEVEFYTEDQREYEYEIDADTGIILSWSYDGEMYIRLQEKSEK